MRIILFHAHTMITKLPSREKFQKDGGKLFKK
jgi:hypothetical protein